MFQFNENLLDHEGPLDDVLKTKRWLSEIKFLSHDKLASQLYSELVSFLHIKTKFNGHVLQCLELFFLDHG